MGAICYENNKFPSPFTSKLRCFPYRLELPSPLFAYFHGFVLLSFSLLLRTLPHAPSSLSLRLRKQRTRVHAPGTLSPLSAADWHLILPRGHERSLDSGTSCDSGNSEREWHPRDGTAGGSAGISRAGTGDVILLKQALLRPHLLLLLLYLLSPSSPSSLSNPSLSPSPPSPLSPTLTFSTSSSLSTSFIRSSPLPSPLHTSHGNTRRRSPPYSLAFTRSSFAPTHASAKLEISKTSPLQFRQQREGILFLLALKWLTNIRTATLTRHLNCIIRHTHADVNIKSK